MITSILLNILLLLCILWVVLLLAFTLSFLRWRKREQAPLKEERTQKAKQEPPSSLEHLLVGRSKGFTSQFIPPFPDTSSKEKAVTNPTTFAKESAETKENAGSKQEQTVAPTPKDVVPETPHEESNEIAVDFTTEEVDETDVLREELGFQEDPREVSPTSILSRDLLRLSQWGMHDKSIAETEETAVKSTLQSLQGTDLLAQYQAHLEQQENAHQKLLRLMRKVEAEEAADAPLQPQLFSATDQEAASHSLDYYL